MSSTIYSPRTQSISTTTTTTTTRTPPALTDALQESALEEEVSECANGRQRSLHGSDPTEPQDSTPQLRAQKRWRGRRKPPPSPAAVSVIGRSFFQSMHQSHGPGFRPPASPSHSRVHNSVHATRRPSLSVDIDGVEMSFTTRTVATTDSKQSVPQRKEPNLLHVQPQMHKWFLWFTDPGKARSCRSVECGFSFVPELEAAFQKKFHKFTVSSSVPCGRTDIVTAQGGVPRYRCFECPQYCLSCL